MTWREEDHPRDEVGRFTFKEQLRQEEIALHKNDNKKAPVYTDAEVSALLTRGIDITDKTSPYYKELENLIHYEDLDKNVDKVLKNNYKKLYIELLKETPIVFRQLGIDNKPMLITEKHTYLAIRPSGKYKGKNDHYHNLGKDLFMQIPKLIENPKMVLQKNNQNIIAVLSAKDKKNNPIIIPIVLKGYSGDKNYIEPHIITSIYGRKNYTNWLNEQLKNSKIIYKK